MVEKTDIRKLTEKIVKEGGVLALLYFDVHAATKEDVQNLGTGFIGHLIKMPGVVYALGEIEEPIGGEDGKNFSSSIVVKILTRNFLVLANICLANSPFTAEILRPDEIKLSLHAAHELLGQLAATTSEYKKTVLTKLATKEELAEFHRQLSARAELGKRVLERKDKKE